MNVYDKRSMESGICKRCADKTCYGYDHRITECEDYQPETNADRIRSMTDEELAEWCLRIAMCPCDAMNAGCSLNDDTCREAWISWLRRDEA